MKQDDKYCAPNCHDQLPNIGMVGRGPKGDSFRINVDDLPKAEHPIEFLLETYLKGEYYDHIKKEWTDAWTSQNINGGYLYGHISMFPDDEPPTFTITFDYKRIWKTDPEDPGSKKKNIGWSWTTPHIPYQYYDPDPEIVGSSVGDVYTTTVEEPTEDDWEEALVFPSGQSGKDYNAPKPLEPKSVNFNFNINKPLMSSVKNFVLEKISALQATINSQISALQTSFSSQIMSLTNKLSNAKLYSHTIHIYLYANNQHVYDDEYWDLDANIYWTYMDKNPNQLFDDSSAVDSISTKIRRTCEKLAAYSSESITFNVRNTGFATGYWNFHNGDFTSKEIGIINSICYRGDSTAHGNTIGIEGFTRVLNNGAWIDNYGILANINEIGGHWSSISKFTDTVVPISIAS